MALATAAWAYVAYQASSMEGMGSAMGGMVMGGLEDASLFLLILPAMMVAMIVPATLPLMLLYRTIARNRLGLVRARVGVVSLLVGYLVVWGAAGLPVYAYDSLAGAALGSVAIVLPGVLLIVGGAYQFTPLSSPHKVSQKVPISFLLSDLVKVNYFLVGLTMKHRDEKGSV